MKNFFKLFLLTAILTIAMSVFAMAETISDSKTLDQQEYTELVIQGSENKEAPVVITIPAEGINVKSASGNNCITIASGNVKFEGGPIYHKNDTNNKSLSIINVSKGAELTLENSAIYGRDKYSTGTPPYDNYDQAVVDGINVASGATLNINSTEIANVNTYGSYVYGSIINNSGTTNINGGSIHDNSHRGGAAVLGFDGNININGGTIYGSTTPLYNIRAVVDIEGGLIVGSIKGSYNIKGEFNTGKIVNTTGGQVKDETANLTVNANMNDVLSANPTHNITTVLNGKTYTGMYYDNTWHFKIPEGEHEHEIEFNANELNLSTKAGSNTAELTAQIICVKGNTTVQDWSVDKSNIISFEKKSNDPNTIIITAKQAGKAVITASTADSLTAQCTVNVAPAVDIYQTKTLTPGTYTDLTIKGSTFEAPIKVTIPPEGITVASTNSDDCITITEGQVTLTGGPIYHKDGHDDVTAAIIRVNPNATLTLDNVTIDGSTGPDSDESEKVMCGIHNEGHLYIQGGTVIKNINADDEIPGNAAIHNASKYTDNPFSLLGCAIYGNTGFSVAGKITAFNYNNIIVGELADDSKSSFVGQGGYKIGVITGTIGETVKMGNYEATAKVGDNLITNGTVTSQLGDHTCVGSYSNNIWEFKAQIKGIASYVKGEKTTTNPSATNHERFESSHIMSGETVENKDAINTESSLSTAFKDDNLKVEGDKAYLLFDVIVPSNTQNTYLRIGTNAKLPSGLSKTISQSGFVANDGQNICLYKVSSNSSDGTTYKYKLTADNTNDSTFGLIINNLYSTDAYAYIKACTKDEYDSATDYKPADVSSGAAAVSLD